MAALRVALSHLTATLDGNALVAHTTCKQPRRMLRLRLAPCHGGLPSSSPNGNFITRQIRPCSAPRTRRLRPVGTRTSRLKRATPESLEQARSEELARNDMEVVRLSRRESFVKQTGQEQGQLTTAEQRTNSEAGGKTEGLTAQEEAHTTNSTRHHAGEPMFFPARDEDGASLDTLLVESVLLSSQPGASLSPHGALGNGVPTEGMYRPASRKGDTVSTSDAVSGADGDARPQGVALDEPGSSQGHVEAGSRSHAYGQLRQGHAAGSLHRLDASATEKAWDVLQRWTLMWNRENMAPDALANTQKIVVFGGGSFGTAVGVMLARNKAELDVVLLVRDEESARQITENHRNPRYFPNHDLPPNIRATTDATEALRNAQYCVHAVPVQHSAAFLQQIAHLVPPSMPILSVSKGLEVSTMETMDEIIPRALGNPRQPVAVLSGPSFSIELMDKKPTAIVAASKDRALAKACQQLLASRYLRVNMSNDVVGVEMAGALKNVLAIAAGIVDGMGLGNNCMAALVAQGCSEIRWLAEKMGAKPATLSGLSGTGDIMLTCFVNLSRNRTVGVRLGRGEKLKDILSTMSQVAEGVATAGAVIALARKYRVSMPVLTAVARILDNELTPKEAVLDLMSLPQVEEV